MKDWVKTNLGKAREDLEGEVASLERALAKLRLDLSLGREKKTHLVKEISGKIAVLKTLINQKKYWESKT